MSRKFRHDARTEAETTAILSTSSSGSPKWRQSPVDLKTIDTWTQKFPPLLLTGYWLKKGRAVMTNTGQTVNIELTNQTKTPYLRGGPLKHDQFLFKNVQFRWGPTDTRGAEHTIDSLWYSMEAQALHWNSRYGSIERCYDKPDGIAILSYLMQVVGCKGMPDNPIISRVTDHLTKIKKMGSSIEVTPDCLWWMLQGCASPGYFTYPGSLTVPPYSECVIWMIFSQSIKISSRQLQAFRSIYDYKWNPIVNNYRPQQHLCGRRVLYATNSAVA
ncbi:hypothetical protein KPH14_006398 [Odynerus spinipes]|uniref:Alpha-carbonic anhydrase domain-containing protein n=1 Tax=Odynerus spinipes TaxID=1348599 RepID=A0AAD9RZ50_9HYME|nr:hypothetical protein KPH14_006398 [Odynerus spinipes]